MDPLRRLLLLGVLASVILTEPGSARASMMDLAGRHGASRDAAAVIAGQFVQRLAAALQQDEEATKVADASRRITARVTPTLSRSSCLAQVGCVHAILSPHEFRPPPPVVA